MSIDHLPAWHEDRFKAKPHPSVEPNQHVINGAREYSKKHGLEDPHASHYNDVHIDPKHMKETAKHYDKLPSNDPKAHHAFRDFRKQVNAQHEHITKNMGIKMEVTHEDPYKDHKEMMHDLHHNKRLKVLSTESTGGHPFLNNHDNDKFRFVHDIFGHAATGRSFDSHGETAAYHAHAKMFHGPAKRAMQTETYGQNSSLISKGKFPEQKIALLPEDHMNKMHDNRHSEQKTSGRASDFWNKMKDKVRERTHKPEHGKDSNPGGFRQDQPGQHRADPSGKHRKNTPGPFSEPQGKHVKEKGDKPGPGKHRMEKDPGLFSAPSGKHVEESGGKHRAEPAGKHRGDPKPGNPFQAPKGKHRKDDSPVPGKNVHELTFHNTDTGNKHILHVHLKDDGSVSHIREHRPEGHQPQRDPNRGNEPHAPANSHPASPQKQKPEIGKTPVRNRPSRGPMEIKGDPLNSPHHQVDRSLNSPIHEQLHRDSQNPLTAPGRHSKPGDATPTHEDANIHNELNQRLKGRPNKVQEVQNPGDAQHMPKDELKARRPQNKKSAFQPREAASGLDQVQQYYNVHDEKDPRSMPGEVMFPITHPWGEETTEDGDYSKDRNGEYRSRTASQQVAVVKSLAMQMRREADMLFKMADQWGANDSPHAVPGGSTANSPATTPPQTPGKSFQQGVQDGQRDNEAGERPSFADASSSAPDYVQGYSQGYSNTQARPNPEDVPFSMGGDSGQGYNSERASQREQDGREPLNFGASLRVSASFTEPEAAYSSDFRKGYRYASTWTPGKTLVRMGSAEFEAGVYAGITDNPGNQRSFVEASRSYDVLKNRLDLHREYTASLAADNYDYIVRGIYVQGSTSTDLNIMGPGVSPDPAGSTPVMGPGTPPPNEGGMNPAREGGPAPYNGAAPYGSPVVENPVMGPAQESPPAENVPGRESEHDTDNDGNRAPNKNIPGEQPMRTSSLDRFLAFKHTVQANLEQRRGQ